MVIAILASRRADSVFSCAWRGRTARTLAIHFDHAVAYFPFLDHADGIALLGAAAPAASHRDSERIAAAVAGFVQLLVRY